MKYLNIDKMREGKLNSILKKQKLYLYEFKFDKKHFNEDEWHLGYPALLQEIKDWISSNVQGNFEYIFESGEFWGIAFQKREDVLLFKMVWS